LYPSTSSCPYSPKCLVGKFSEVRIAPVLLLGGHGPEWGVAAGARESLIRLLRECAPQLGVCSVVLDPPASLRGGEAPPLSR
jgi:hypothetical protein